MSPRLTKYAELLDAYDAAIGLLEWNEAQASLSVEMGKLVDKMKPNEKAAVSAMQWDKYEKRIGDGN